MPSTRWTGVESPEIDPAAVQSSPDFESSQAFVPVPSSAEVPVYSTRRRWRGVDVFVAASANCLSNNEQISIYVYAVARGARALVASGVIAGPTAQQVWVAAARVQAERFDVTVSHAGVPNVTGGDPLSISVIASDECVPTIPPMIGVWPVKRDAVSLLPQLSSLTLAQIPPPGPGLQLVAIHAVNVSAAAKRWIQVFDVITPGNGTVPMFSFPLSDAAVAATGDGITIADPILQQWRFTTALTVAASSTGDTLTSVVDVPKQVWFR